MDYQNRWAERLKLTSIGVLGRPAKNWTGNKYKWTVLLDKLGYTNVSEAFAKRINKADTGEVLTGYIFPAGKKRRIKVHIVY